MIRRTPDDVANEVRLQRTQFDGAVLIAEGGPDGRIYRRAVDKDAARVVVALGKANAIGAINILRTDHVPGVVAVVDRDYSSLLGPEIQAGDVVVTDGHDIEVMLLTSDALGKVLEATGSGTKVQRFRARTGEPIGATLLSVAAPLGALRMISERDGLDLRFEGVVTSRFIGRDLQVDVHRMVGVVVNHSQRHDLDIDLLESGVRAVLNAGHPLQQLACGHDAVEGLAIGLRASLGSVSAADASPRRVSRELELAYEASFFRNTELFERLRGWEAANPPYRLFTP